MIDINNLKKHLVLKHTDPKFAVQTQELMGFKFEVDNWAGAVVCLVTNEHLLLIERSEQMPSHRGQLGLIGGYRQKAEVSPVEVALREFKEETSFESKDLEVIGLLPPVFTSFDNQVIPVLVNYSGGLDILSQINSNGEWSDAFLVPLRKLGEIESWNYAWRHSENSNGSLLFYTLLAHNYLAKESNQANKLLWGATARMVWNFLRITHKY